MHVPAKLNVERLQNGLRTRRFGKKIIFLRGTRSTNDLAKKLAGYGVDEGTVVIAETQKAGRGRLGRRWFSPMGGLWFSVVLRPKLRVSEALRLVFVAGLAVAETLHELYGLSVETKWPNDVLLNKRKICGILSEMNTSGGKVNSAIVGIGVNVNFDVRESLPKELWQAVTSLENELHRRVRLEDLFKSLLENLEKEYDLLINGDYIRVLDDWKRYASFLGHEVEVTSDSESVCGSAIDVDFEGALIIKLKCGSTKRVIVGDVSLTTK